MVDSAENKSSRVGVEVSSAVFRAVSVGGSGAVDKTFSAPVASEPRGTQLVSFINRLKTEFGNFDRIGLAFPGLVDRAAQRVAFSAHIPEHSDGDLVRDVQSATGLQITIENDANAAAYGEFKLGAGRGSRNMFYITLGEGVGGAFIFEGEIWRGAAGFAGEFGYVPINSEGTKLEEVASSANIIRRTRGRFHQDNTSSLNSLEEEAITLEDIIRAAQKEDDFAQMMLKRTGSYVGSAVASVINLLNIEKVVVGGEIMSAEHLVLDAIIDRARELSFKPSFKSTSIVEGSLGENAAAVGAALLAN
ncbi:MAG: ROK family protein [Pyrinomonadaceae bacterium]